jgi:hypothetical protein
VTQILATRPGLSHQPSLFQYQSNRSSTRASVRLHPHLSLRRHFHTHVDRARQLPRLAIHRCHAVSLYPLSTQYRSLAFNPIIQILGFRSLPTQGLWRWILETFRVLTHMRLHLSPFQCRRPELAVPARMVRGDGRAARPRRRLDVLVPCAISITSQ